MRQLGHGSAGTCCTDKDNTPNLRCQLELGPTFEPIFKQIETLMLWSTALFIVNTANHLYLKYSFQKKKKTTHNSKEIISSYPTGSEVQEQDE